MIGVRLLSSGVVLLLLSGCVSLCNCNAPGSKQVLLDRTADPVLSELPDRPAVPAVRTERDSREPAGSIRPFGGAFRWIPRILRRGEQKSCSQ